MCVSERVSGVGRRVFGRRRSLSLLVDLSVEVSIKLGEVLLAVGVGALGEMSCGSTGCLSCRGKQSTSSSSSSSSSSGRSLLFSVAGVSVGDSIKLGKGSVGEMSCCCSTGCLSCRGKQSTSSLLSSSSGRSLLFSIIS